MRLRSLILLGLGLLLLGVGLLWWRQADRSVAGNNQAAPAGDAAVAPVRAGRSATTNQESVSESTVSVLPGGKKSSAKTDPLVYRFSNTTKSSQQLLRDDNALILENALIDSRQPVSFQIPERLRSVGDPGSYIVQSRGPLDAAFRRALADAGAEYVSYIPNNAWLVRATKEVAARLAASPETQAVLPWEPIYKLKTELLVLAMENKPLPPNAKLNLLIYNGAQAAVFEQLDQLQLVRLAEDRSPFGTVVTVQPGLDWMTLAQLPGVQLMERAYPRARANDLTRVRIGVAADSRTATNYLGLTGTNVLLSINDWGVDALHPDFTSRLFALNPVALGDTNGHGTHVAGIMAGSGLSSTNVTNARGSINPATNFQYRGIAPGARIFAQLASEADGDLQENVARTNAFISNNSWGYLGDSTYSLAAASYDAAVRDSLPGVPGSQPVLYVFSAGNEGGGTDVGLGGSPGSLSSPATAKNVVSVGAGELLRDVTNQVEKVTSGVTNTTTPWQAMTSSDNQVAAFSSRGNVGIRIEGDFGRFKPDVIAPGTFVISTRSSTWDERAYYNPTNHNRSLLQNQIVNEGGFNTYPIFLPENTVGFTIALIANDDSPVPFPDLPLYLRRDDAPTLATFDLRTTNFVAVPPSLGGVGTAVGQNWFFAVANPTDENVTFDILTDIITTNDLGNYLTVLSNLNNSLSGTNLPPATNFYRYESGTSMAAPAVSGTLGLMQEFFEKQQRTNSPALMKALLINGARTIANIYDFRVQNTINYQGWGMINLANSLPNTVNDAFNLTPASAGAIKLVDQSPTNALATGQSHTRRIALSELGQTAPLRITLVWTDPAANPAAGVKLVNDLDLVVTNLDTGDIYFGNDFPNVDPYNNFWDTNEPPVIDSVNNVENVYLSPFLGTNYSITVSARRVNVNAVTAHTNDVVQDYALVISSGNGEFTNAFAISNQVFNVVPQLSQVIFVTNTITQSDFAASYLENQRVGANPALVPLLNSTNGMTNQWKFFVVTNTSSVPPFTNAAFLISLQTDLATPRMGVFAEDAEVTRRYADLDLYVSLNAGLTNLDPTVVAASFQSRSRNDLSGDEFVIFTNSAPGLVYYVGVKSEDQMAAQFDFFAIFSLLPLGAEDGNGFVRAYPLTGFAIPEGPPSNPGGTRFVAITPPSTSGEAESVRRVIITNYLSHDHFGDLINTVDHNSRVVVMDNHRSLATPPYPVPPGPYAFLYDDSGEGGFLNSIETDGPGSLNSFQGEAPGGTWYFTYSDDALTQVGSVSNVMIRVERQCESDCTLTNTVAPNSWSYFSRNIPVEATNFTVCINIISPSPQPLQLYIRKDRRPTATLYDYTMTINPSGCLSVDKFDLPPLMAGRYFIGVFNGNPTAQTFTYQSIVELGEPPTPVQFGSVGSAPLLDDAVTNHTVFVTETNPISRLDVGLRIDHPRVSDLAVTLVSPRGTRVLLVENRGGTDPNGFGTSLTVTNFVPVDAAGGPAAVTNFIDTGATVGTVNIDYDFFGVADQMTVYYQGLQLTNTGLIPGAGRLTVAYGPGASTIVEVRMNEFGNPSTNTAWEYTISSINNSHSYLIFTDNTNKTTTPIKFAAPPFVGTPSFVAGISDFELPVLPGDYVAPLIGTPDGWDVLTNTVTVITNTAYTGTNSLALRSGAIQRTLPTVAGRTYRLGYAYRKAPNLDGLVAWWELEGNWNDRVGTNVGTPSGNPAFVAGEVGTAMTFDGVDDHVFVPASSSLNVGAGNGLTIETWIKPSNLATQRPLVEWNDGSDIQTHFWISVPALGGGPGSLWANLVDTANVPHAISSLPGLLVPNVYQHVAMTYDRITGVCTLYLNGNIVAQNNLGNFTPDTRPNLYLGYRPAGVAAGARYVGDMDEVSIFNRALTATEITNIFVAGTAGKCGMVIPPDVCSPPLGAQISIPGQVTNSFLGTTSWQIGGLFFTATNASTVVNLTPLNPNVSSGALVDTFTLTEAGGSRYVLPEESLKTYEGEIPYGLWTLEILDNRTGAFNNVALVDWQLQIVAQDNKPLPGALTPGGPMTNSVPPGGIVYYIVDVPPWAQYATNQLLFASGPVNVLFNQNTPPVGVVLPDYLLIGPNAIVGSRTLDAGSTPPLLPGLRYYLGVQNPGTSNVTFALQVDFNITALTNGIVVNSTLAASAQPRYFYYDISTNATATSFRLFGLNGNVDLVARRGAPLPTLLNNDYGSFNPGVNNEDIVLLPASTPVPLTPGRWYLGVFNRDVVPVTYNIVATEFTNTLPNIVTLTNAIPYTNTNSGAGAGVDYYRFVVSPGSVRAQFEINTPSDDVTLVARKGLPLPDLGLYDYISANVYTNDELIVLTTNSAPVILSPGDWFLTVVNLTGLPVSYSIKATEWSAAEVAPFVITSYTIASNEFCITWNSLPGAYYFVQGKTNLNVPAWTTLSPQITAVDYSTTWCIPLPSPYQFFRVGEGLVLSTYVPPPRIQSLTVGTNGVTLRWNGPITASYNVQWSPSLAPPVWGTFTNVITSTTGLFQFVDDGTQTSGLGVTRYYRLILLP